MAAPSESEAEARALAWRLAHGEPIDDVGALAFHLRARAVLGRVLTRLEEASVPALVVKGAVLAHTLYASPIERPIRDVDLRVLPADLARASRALVAAGARLLVTSRVYGIQVVSFEKVEIDLESSIGPPFVCALSVASMLARAERTTGGLGYPYLRPELHDHVLLLLVNLFKDRVAEAARWRLRDLELLARAPAFDSGVLAARAEEGRCRTIVHIVARYLADTLADARWAWVAARIAPARPRYAARVLASLRGARRLPLLAWRLEVRDGADTPARRIAALGATAMRELELAALRVGAIR